MIRSRVIAGISLLALASTPFATVPAAAQQGCGSGRAHGRQFETVAQYGSHRGDPAFDCDHVLMVTGKYSPGGWGHYTFWGPNGHIHTTGHKFWPRDSRAAFEFLNPAHRGRGLLWCAAFRNGSIRLSEACVTS